jgi:hypothetical protein
MKERERVYMVLRFMYICFDNVRKPSPSPLCSILGGPKYSCDLENTKVNKKTVKNIECDLQESRKRTCYFGTPFMELPKSFKNRESES